MTIKGIGSRHRMLASIPASILNQNSTDLGIPNRNDHSSRLERAFAPRQRGSGLEFCESGWAEWLQADLGRIFREVECHVRDTVHHVSNLSGKGR